MTHSEACRNVPYIQPGITDGKNSFLRAVKNVHKQRSVSFMSVQGITSFIRALEIFCRIKLLD